jgi:hypothetical protein
MSVVLSVVEAPAALETLEELADAVRREHALAAQAGATMVEHAIRAGDALRAAKNQIERGGWERWIAQEFPDKHAKTLRLYMRLSKYQEHVRTMQPGSIVHAQQLLAGEAIRPHETELRDAARNLSQRGKTQKQITAELGVSLYAVQSWLNPRLLERRRSLRAQESRAARRALHQQQRQSSVRKVGGPIAEGYALVRRALQTMEHASEGQLDSEARQAVLKAISRLHAAEDQIVRASKLA